MLEIVVSSLLVDDEHQDQVAEAERDHRQHYPDDPVYWHAPEEEWKAAKEEGGPGKANFDLPDEAGIILH